MEYTEFKPSEVFSELVKYFWLLDFRNEDPQSFKVLPHGCPELVITLSGGISINDHETRRLPQSIFVGYRMRAIDLVCEPFTCLAGIRYKPFTILNQDALLKDNIISAGHKIYKLTLKKELTDRLLHCNADTNIIESAFNEICRELSKNKQYFNSHANVLQKHNTKELTQISDITVLTSLCERQVQKLFKKNFDITPKEYLRVSRLLSVIESIHMQSHKPPKTIIADSGYFDHAHFCHEFKKLWGLPVRSISLKSGLLKGKPPL